MYRTAQEAERRQRQIEDLQSKYIRLESEFKLISCDDFQKNELLGVKKQSYWENDDDDDEIDDGKSTGHFDSNKNKPQTVDDIRHQQNRILEDQNEGLEALSKIISRQKHLALRIHDEVDDQNG